MIRFNRYISYFTFIQSLFQHSTSTFSGSSYKGNLWLRNELRLPLLSHPVINFHRWLLRILRTLCVCTEKKNNRFRMT